MGTMIHRLVGGAVLLSWLWMVWHLGRWAPGLDTAASSGIWRAGRGADYVLFLPLLGAALLIFPDFFVKRFSPSSELTNEPLFGTGFWRFFGYFALLVSWGLLQLFSLMFRLGIEDMMSMIWIAAAALAATSPAQTIPARYQVGHFFAASRMATWSRCPLDCEGAVP